MSSKWAARANIEYPLHSNVILEIMIRNIIRRFKYVYTNRRNAYSDPIWRFSSAMQPKCFRAAMINRNFLPLNEFCWIQNVHPFAGVDAHDSFGEGNRSKQLCLCSSLVMKNTIYPTRTLWTKLQRNGEECITIHSEGYNCRAKAHGVSINIQHHINRAFIPLKSKQSIDRMANEPFS